MGFPTKKGIPPFKETPIHIYPSKHGRIGFIHDSRSDKSWSFYYWKSGRSTSKHRHHISLQMAGRREGQLNKYSSCITSKCFLEVSSCLVSTQLKQHYSQILRLFPQGSEWKFHNILEKPPFQWSVSFEVSFRYNKFYSLPGVEGCLPRQANAPRLSALAAHAALATSETVASWSHDLGLSKASKPKKVQNGLQTCFLYTISKLWTFCLKYNKKQDPMTTIYDPGPLK